MSHKYGEIIKNPYFFVWGNARQRATQATPPTPPRRESAELTRGKRANAGRGGEIQKQNWDAENGGKGGKLRKTTPLLNGSIFRSQIQNEDSLHPSSLYCVDKTRLSPSGALWSPLASLYSGAEPIKGSPSQQPALSRLHYIL
jgi:hypothetical protein